MGQHRKAPPRRRWPLVALALLAVLAVGAAVVYQVRRTSTCEPVPVAVAVDATLVEPVQRALADDPGAGCARYQVSAAPAELASEIRSGSPGLPAVWIPQSSLALDPLEEGIDTLVRKGAPVASSPMVLALPAADAARYGDPAQPVAWNTLLTSERPPGLPDPAAEPGGLAALTALRTALGDEAGRPRPAFVAAVLALHEGAPESSAAGFEAIARDGAGARAFLTSELAVVRHNAARSAAPSPAAAATGPDGAHDGTAAALALADGATVLDYPFVRIVPPGSATQPPQVEAAIDHLEERLRSRAGQDALTAAGLRGPDGTRVPTAPGAGMLAADQVDGTVPESPAAVETLRLWSALTLRSRLLAVIDTSGSMAAQAGPTDRIGLAAAAAQGGLSLFPDSSTVGLWSFPGERSGQPWQELVPIGGLSEPVGAAPTRRAALAAQAATLRERLGGPTALYDTAIAATRAVRAGYQPGASNAVVMITDGRNEVDGGIDLATAVQTLRAEADPTRPVPLIAIGIGPDSDQEALRQLAESTGGRAYLAENPQDIRTVFLDALSQRVCRPGC